MTIFLKKKKEEEGVWPRTFLLTGVDGVREQEIESEKKNYQPINLRKQKKEGNLPSMECSRLRMEWEKNRMR